MRGVLLTALAAASVALGGTPPDGASTESRRAAGTAPAAPCPAFLRAPTPQDGVATTEERDEAGEADQADDGAAEAEDRDPERARFDVEGELPPIPGTGPPWTLTIVDRHDRSVPNLVVVVRFSYYRSRSYQRGNVPSGTVRLTTDAAGAAQVVPPDDATAATVDVDAPSGWMRVPSLRCTSGGEIHVVGDGVDDDVRLAEPTTKGWRPLRWRTWESEPIGGRVVDGEGNPVAGAVVRGRWRRLVSASPEPVTSGADGTFSIPAPSGDRLDLDSAAPEPDGDAAPAAERTAHLPGVLAGARGVVLAPSGRVEVRCEVVDERGRPAPAWSAGVVELVGDADRVFDRRFPPDATEPAFTLKAPRAGRYLLRFGRSVGLARFAPRLERVLAAREVDVPGPAVRIVAESHARLAGRVLGADVADFRISWCGDDGFRLDPTRCDADGAFEIRGVGEEGELHVARPGDDRYAVVRDVRTGCGPVDVVLQEGLRIEGAWVGGGDADAVEIRAQRDGVVRRGVIDVAGRFRVCGLPPGTYRLTVECNGETWTLDDVEAGVADLAIAPPP